MAASGFIPINNDFEVKYLKTKRRELSMVKDIQVNKKIINLISSIRKYLLP